MVAERAPVPHRTAKYVCMLAGAFSGSWVSIKIRRTLIAGDAQQRWSMGSILEVMVVIRVSSNLHDDGDGRVDEMRLSRRF